ncbi:glycosyl transferase, partial [Metarhizium majus ARSEF 297]
MAGMACGPDTLADSSQLDVRPLPVGGRAHPKRFLEAADTILARGWTVLVSRRTLKNYLVAEDNMRGSRENLPEDCQWMEYAFVRSGSDVRDGKPQVVGVREFLEIMAPEVDLDLVERELAQTASQIETWEEQAPSLPSMEASRLLDVDDEQDNLFREFLRSTAVADTRDHPETDLLTLTTVDTLGQRVWCFKLGSN